MSAPRYVARFVPDLGRYAVLDTESGIFQPYGVFESPALAEEQARFLNDDEEDS